MNDIAFNKITVARIKLEKDFPFFSYLALHLRFKEVKPEECLTIGVSPNCKCVYNPEFINKLTYEETMAVLSHEILHVALEHLASMPYVKFPQVANIAMDLVINDMLITNNLNLPKEGIIPYNHTFEFKEDNIKITDINKRGWREIYIMLENKIKKDMKKMGFDIHSFGKPGEEASGDKAGENVEGKLDGTPEDGWPATLSRAYTHAKMQGKEPAGVDRFIQELCYPKINWKQMLQKFIIRELPYDFSYMRPSRRALASGIYLPACIKENLDIVVAADTSGSIGQEELMEYASEVYGVIKAYENVTLTLVCCDAEITNTQVIATEEDLSKINFKGGGGTDFRPVFDWMKKEKPNAKVLIYFTDGYGEFPEDIPNLKMLWCVSEGGLDLDKIPFGETVSLERRDRK